MSYCWQERHPEQMVVCHTAMQGWHLTNLEQCPSCIITYCASCSWGCPKCAFGRGHDRRQGERRAVPGLRVDVQPEEESA